MSIMKSLYTAATGLGAQSDAMGVVGHNISNVNTLGYKSSRARFDEMVTNAVGLRRIAGQGSRLAGIDALFTQGALLSTGVPTDLAIQGSGFFVLNGTVSGVNGNFYTRVGQFQIDAEGKLASPDGLKVQGYLADATGTITNQLGDVQLPTSVPPAATQNVDMSINLDSDLADSAIPTVAYDPENPASYNHRTTMTAYDSLGNAHSITVDFRRTANLTWEWHALANNGEMTSPLPPPATDTTLVESASGTLTFTDTGYLNTETANPSTGFDFAGGAAQNQVIDFDFGDSITTDGGTGMTGSTAYSGSTSVNALSQDGYGSGSIAGFAVQQDGLVTAAFTNGQTRTVAQLAVASFRAEQGLVGMGGSLYAPSEASGEPLVGTANSGGRGAINAGALESSNVDMSREMVNLIAFQRAFQANARTVTTADEMMSELVNLKR